jgi:3',5'-cyclic-AMP phosphodiesterase
MGKGRLTICQISDIHCGNTRFIPELLDRTIIEINRLEPTAVVVAGDLTDAGYREEFEQAAGYIDCIECEHVMVIPGNHDARNVGYIHFERLFGERHSVIDLDDVILVGVDSSEPDLNDGQVGREHYGFISSAFSEAPDKLKVFVVHHHLISLPGTGRERNIVYDAGDVLERLMEVRVDLVLSGHKHVPYVWRLENLYIVNAGTCSSLRLRGHTRPCYNIVELEGDELKIFRKFPFGASTRIAHFSMATGQQFYRELENLVQEPVGQGHRLSDSSLDSTAGAAEDESRSAPLRTE